VKGRRCPVRPGVDGSVHVHKDEVGEGPILIEEESEVPGDVGPGLVVDPADYFPRTRGRGGKDRGFPRRWLLVPNDAEAR
jgi:hypothetical protein